MNYKNFNIRYINELGYIATVDRKKCENIESGVVYALGNTRKQCIERLERAIIFYKNYSWNGPLGGWKSKP